ncbi:hypothetical protein NQ314_004965 [Rhamnusium bicolor]|uniref:DUF5641 domain-containing protein n=1 Tax=Rhamnusium bicolor TaxID=1586634 RepID=A0AAV8ZLA4_9CUCU|nr:hypothetical protein NQ314_004965 [Rhamnusium bicolor]
MWELEDFTPSVPTFEDSICENYFVENVSRNSFGRYEVALPFKADPTYLGDSFALSQTRLFSLEKRLEKNLELRNTYFFENSTVDIVEFADASFSAYAAVIYIRSTDITGHVSVNFLCAQSKVASMSKVTLPGLELCAAVQLSKGLSPASLINHPCWFSGPQWLLLNPTQWPIKSFSNNEFTIPEEENLVYLVVKPTISPLYILIEYFSSWTKLLHSTIYVLKFLKILPRNNTIRKFDLDQAEYTLIRAVQQRHFHSEYKLLSENKPLKSNFLRKLNLFIKDHIIRVGGRLSNANVAFDHKHPILLPKSDPFVNLLIDYNHKKYCHTGTHLLQSLLQQNYWILAARGIIRQRIWKCNHCFRLNPKPNYPIMSDLSSERVNQAKAFLSTAEDLVTESPNRLNRYKLLDSVVQHYWKRWHIEYFSTLQARQKWNPAQIGMIVVIIQNNIPPLQWPLAIIEKLYPGKDGISRVAPVRTKNSSYTRPVAKLCPLPNQS